MQLYDALKQLTDVPPTFRRPTPFYQQLMAALAGALTLLTESSSANLDQATYQQTVAGWIDVWADLAGILRRTGEADSVFQERTQDMLLAARDSIVAIQTWLEEVENISSSIVIENPQIGYSVTLPGNLTPQRVADVAKNLAWVRPAGVPFNYSSRSGGTYLNTVNYLGGTVWGAPLINDQEQVILTNQGSPILVTGRFPWQGARVTGAFLALKFQINNGSPPASTNNNISLLPDLLLQDPTLNPNLTTPLITLHTS